MSEGYGRFTYSDTRNFFIVSRGSVTETMEHLTTTYDEGYITEIVFKEFEAACQECLRLINGYINYLKQQAES